MSHPLELMMAERIGAGLMRKSIDRCSKWSERYRIIGGGAFAGKWGFKYHPWLRDMHDCKDELIVGKKAAQMGYTETALNKTFFNIDIHRNNCLYILPTSTPDASDFSTSRFDPALEDSPHLAKLFSDVKNIGHKRAGSANLFIRGSRARNQLKSVPAPFIVMDELDEFVQDNIPMVFERASGQIWSQVFMISTPTIDKYGISKYHDASSQDLFFFNCPHCSRFITLTFPDCLVITGDDPTDASIRNSHLICSECEHKLDHRAKTTFLADGRWEASYTNRNSRGFYINQLFSSTVEPYKLAISYLNGQTDPAEEQEFFNSKLGLVHAVDGAKVTDTMIEECKGGHRRLETYNKPGIITLGADIGKLIHFEIDQWFPTRYNSTDPNISAHCKLLAHGTVKEFEELDQLMRDFGVLFAVIDAQPERRKSLSFCKRFHGMAKACYYSRGATGKVINAPENEEHIVKVDRTAWLDLSLGRFKNQSITLPFDVNREYCQHVKAPVRIYKKTEYNESVGEYKCGNEADHYAHARNYSEIAYRLITGFGVNTDITGVL